ncbi:hypothetical protein AMELA_G00244110, partial [Ameiurus melas]
RWSAVSVCSCAESGPTSTRVHITTNRHHCTLWPTTTHVCLGSSRFDSNRYYVVINFECWMYFRRAHTGRATS